MRNRVQPANHTGNERIGVANQGSLAGILPAHRWKMIYAVTFPFFTHLTA